MPRYAALPNRERPTFHEIRGRDPRTDDPFLRKTTAIYLERGRDGLSDEDFLAVQAPFTLKDLLGG